jgi:tetratricopeptide (TPR) repeat protein
MLSLNVFGRLQLLDEFGTDLTPKSRKARALLALLALSKDHIRTRLWLQDKLWSDRDAKHASESLRQTLTGLRKALGPHATVLVTDRETVALNTRLFAVVRNRSAGFDVRDDAQEPFDGLDIKDPEFEDWIRDQRLALSDGMGAFHVPGVSPHKAGNPAIFFSCKTDLHPDSDILLHDLLSLATTSLLDFSDFSIFRATGDVLPTATAQPQRGVGVSLVAAQRSGHVHLAATINHPATGQIFWTRSFQVDVVHGERDDDRIHPVYAQLVEAILSTLRQRHDALAIPNCAALLADKARGLIFQFDTQSLAEGDRYLHYAYAQEGRPQYLAWRAFLRNMAHFQHRRSDFLEHPIDVADMAQEAIRQAPGSAIALGVGAHIEYLSGGSHRSSLQLASRAIGYDPLNAINHAILSNTQLVLGDLSGSRQSALTALALAGAGEHRAYVEFFGCMAAAALGDYQAAIDHAEAALILRPSFRAPLRYLVALYKQAGMQADLQRATGRLRQLEPDFYVERFLDDDYPVTTMRRIRLIEAIAR